MEAGADEVPIHDSRSVTILHISDTQFGRYHRFGDGVDSLAFHLVRDLRRVQEEGVPPADLIILSGDIAEQGRKPEYVDARAFIDALLEHTGLDSSRVVVVPGNHDVSWALSEAYFAECRDEEVEPKQPYTRKWRNYQAFVSSLHGEAAFTEDQPYRFHRFDELGLAVAALNSTWRESHRESDHLGWCGLEQYYWFEEQFANVKRMARIAVVHHNARRGALADNENLIDADDLTNILGSQLDLLLHGHTHKSTEDRLADGTLILATGSAAVTPDWRPAEVPNQYQILQLRPEVMIRWARQWDADTHEWISDPRISKRKNNWRAELEFRPPGWKPKKRASRPRRDEDESLAVDLKDLDPNDRKRDDFIEQVEFVTRRDVGDAFIDRRHKGNPPLDYLVVIQQAAPRRYIGILDALLDEDTLNRFDELVFGSLRDRGGTDLILVYRGLENATLRREAKRRGIQLKTWTEYNNLLEPSAYTQWLRGQLDSDSLYPQSLYLEQRFQTIDRWGKKSKDIREDLANEIYDELLDDDGQFFLVLGDAGFGKSFLVRRLAYQMLINEKLSISPIVIYLRDRDKRQTVDEMVSNVLIPSRASFNADRFQHSLEAGCLALLIDGYDEFAVRVGYTNAAAQLQTFINALQGKAKVLLTTRPNHFRSADEATSKLFESLRTVHQGRVYELEPFDDMQQVAFLARWFEIHNDGAAETTARAWMSALQEVDNLPELAKTPRMLSFMVEDLKLSEIEAAAAKGKVTAADLYQRLITRWLTSEAEKIDPDDERSVSASRRQQLLEELALELWRAGERDVTEESLHQVARTLDLPRYEMTLDQAAQLIGGRTLLQVDAQRWRFAHQSVWEFLLAKRLARALREEKEVQVIGEAELTNLTIRFLRDLAPTETTRWVTDVAEGRS
jgi:3',5'-cyclic AMP phosphodiesterase CpdA